MGGVKQTACLSSARSTATAIVQASVEERQQEMTILVNMRTMTGATKAQKMAITARLAPIARTAAPVQVVVMAAVAAAVVTTQSCLRSTR